MNDNRGIGFLRRAILLLVLCNIGLLATIWVKWRPAREAYRPGRELPRDFVIRNLNFSKDQVTEYDKLIQEHQQAMRQLNADSRALHDAFFSSLATENGRPVNIDSVSKLLADNQQKIDMVTYRHFEQVKKLCTDSQRKAFDNIISDVLRKMGAHPGAPPGGPGGPPPGAPPPPDGQGPPPGGPPPPNAP